MFPSAHNPDESEAQAARARPFEDYPALLAIVRQGNDSYTSQGFTLSRTARLRIYALGECPTSDACVDYGWIEKYRTHERVWELAPGKGQHAGGDPKNQYADETISLPAGDYVVYYVTDDSHAFGAWNKAPPHDREHWGIAVYGVDRPSSSDFKLFDPGRRAEAEGEYLVQLVRVGDDEKRLSHGMPRHLVPVGGTSVPIL